MRFHLRLMAAASHYAPSFIREALSSGQPPFFHGFIVSTNIGFDQLLNFNALPVAALGIIGSYINPGGITFIINRLFRLFYG